jgi:YggT family protein
VVSLVSAIHLVSIGLTIIIFADIIVSYFLSPYHPLRNALDSIVQPMLAPIRRILPPAGMLDFSPLVLIFIIQIVEEILIRLLI